jgi:hypothetical protein
MKATCAICKKEFDSCATELDDFFGRRTTPICDDCYHNAAALRHNDTLTIADREALIKADWRSEC